MNYYPTKQHEKAAKKIVDIFSKDEKVFGILLVGSCARGKASKDSCLDIYLLVKDKKVAKELENKFQEMLNQVKEFKDLEKAGVYSHIDLIARTGKIFPKKRDWTSGPDEYELEIGNIFFYSVLLFDRDDYFQKLKKKFIPYYSEELRVKRLAEVKKYLFNNLGHIPLYIERELYFQSFKRLYDATREFLQALFIKNRIYPIAYDKWIKEQLVEILKKPELYKEFVSLYEIKKLESNELIKKARNLNKLAEKYLQ